MPKVGDTVWVFDYNRRVYPKDESGKSIGHSPIWREHWRPEKIIGENRISWLAGSEWRPIKIPKKGHDHRLYAFSEREIERAAWVEKHGWRIADAVRRLGYDKLREIAKIAGYVTQDETETTDG